jgi:hypothetical protein
MNTSAPFGRPMRYGEHATCGHCTHARRLLVAMMNVLGRPMFADLCLVCGARTEWIARRDLAAADVNCAILPRMERGD